MAPSFFMRYVSLSIIAYYAASFDKNNDNNTERTTPMVNHKIKITAGSQIFKATLSNNNSANKFRELLPLTMTMAELNGNEKYGNLPCPLTSDPSSPETIKAGDLMLYDSQTLVVFYKTFTTAYHYTKLGSIEDAAGLEKALGPGNVLITFEHE